MTTPQPPEFNLVKVYGYVVSPDNVPVADTKVVYSIINRPKEFSNLAIDKTYHSTYTDCDGYFEINFIPGLLIKIVIPVTGRTITGVVPLQGEIEFGNLSLL